MIFNLKLKKIFILFLFLFSVFFISKLSFSYDDKTTHPGLTDEIIDFYNLNFSNEQLTNEEKEWIVQGSVDEDIPPRWINHFYDPIYKVGWSGENTGIWPTLMIQYFSGVALSNQDPVSSLNWIHNQVLQSQYGQYKGNRTWERAIYEAVNGNKKEAYYTLGFILHLIEDASVPDHTRNDTHAHELSFLTGDYGSPYEEYSKQYTRETLNIAKEFKQKNEQPIFKSSIDDYLISLAEYSNKFFFSKDTINDSKYEFPKIVRNDENFGYGKDENNIEFPLTLLKKKWNENIKDYELVYTLDQNTLTYKPILDAYFSHLSMQAVLSGVGIINLFKIEVAKSEKDKLGNLPKESATIWSFIGRYYQVKNFITQSFNFISNQVNNFTDSLSANLSFFLVNTNNQIQNNIENLATISSLVLQGDLYKNFNSSINQLAKIKEAIVSPINNIIVPVEQTQIYSNQLLANLQTKINDLQNQLNQLAINNSADNNQGNNNALVVLQEATPTISQKISYNNPALLILAGPDILNTPTPILSPIGNPNTLQENWMESLTSSPSSLSEVLEEQLTSTPTPTPTFTPIPTPTPTLTPTPGTQPLDIVINEISWMGTKANSADEWIELYNNTDSDIDLTDWVLSAPDGSPKIEFSDAYKKKVKENKDKTPIIKSKSYFLLERTDDSPTSKTGDWFFTGALNNADYGQTDEQRKQKEGLILKNGEIIIDKISLWYAGDNNSKLSMERISVNRNSDDPDNWKNNDEKTKNGKDAKGNDIFGTPKEKNSPLNILNNSYDRDVNFYPETIYNIKQFILSPGRTLTIHPGVIIKFIYLSQGFDNFVIKGTLIANGVSDKKIYFTSAQDDSLEAGGDTNGDGNATSPVTGDWRRIWFSDSQNSIIENTEIRYGGRYEQNCCSSFINTPIYLENSSLTIENSIIKDSFYSGILLKKQSNLIMNNTRIINATQLQTPYTYQFVGGYGVYMEGYVDNSAKIYSSYFENLKIGIYAQSYGILEIKNNQFKNSGNPIEAPIYGQNSQFSHSGNIDLGGNGAIKIQSSFIPNGADLILNKDTFPYLIFTLTIPQETVLNILPGVIIKFDNAIGYQGGIIKVEGILKAIGASDEKIYFTAVTDDEIGGDTNLDGSQTAPYPGFWHGLYFTKTGGSEIKYVSFKYGGASQSTSGGFIYRYGSLTIGYLFDIENNFLPVFADNISIEKNGDYAGIIVYHNAKFNISNSVIKDIPQICNGFGSCYGSGILISSGGNQAEFKADNVILENVGTAINFSGGSLSTIINSSFLNNYIGIFYGSGTNSISNSLFKNNIIGIQYYHNAAPEKENLFFEGNQEDEKNL